MRLGHAGKKALQGLVKQGLLKGAKTCKIDFCKHCVFRKQTRVKFGTVIHQTKGTLDYVHTDVRGPSKVASLGGKHYFVSFFDDYSCQVWVYIMRHKDEEYKSDPFFKVCQDEDIACHFTIRGTLQQNGVVERMNRTLLEKVRCMLSQANLGKEFWAKAVSYACQIINRLPAAANEGKTPLQVEFETPVISSKSDIDSDVEVDEGNSSDESEAPALTSSQLTDSIAVRRARREIRKPAKFVDMVAYALPMFEDDIPSTYKEVVRTPESNEWKKAMDDEMQSLHKNQTWDLVQLPKGKKEIGCKWVYTKKEGPTGKDSVRFKARLVAKGFAQTEGIDYNEVFSLVVKHSSIRILLAMVAQFDLKLAQLDVKTTFLHGDLEEEIYMSQPDGFKVAGKENWVCKLKRSLYGLKQSPRQCSLLSPHIDEEREYMAHIPYTSLVGSLMYAMSTIALSTTEAEYMAMIEAIKEAIWLHGLIEDLGILQEHVYLFCDSQSAIHLAKNQVHHSQTKHIDIRFHFICDIVDEGDILLQKIGTIDNPTNMMTKPIPLHKFKYCLDLLGVCSM
uniref:Integrase catalytic domain-containing protein n=1 Tax=Fagus sylvatica TaxID=28930 RepID=A0A2N9I8X0_FAGSY